MFNENTELPHGWLLITLGQLGEWSSGGTPSRSHAEYYGGDIPWIKTGNLPDGLIEEIDESITWEGLANSSAKVFPNNSLIVAMYGATIGKLGILKESAATNQACAALLSKGLTTEIIPYVFYYFLNRREHLKSIGQGGAQPNISQTVLKEYPCPLPPLNEQRRIVAKIEALKAHSQRVKEELEAIAPLLNQFRQSVLSAAFRGELTADWRIQDNDEFLSYDFPSTWNKRQLGDVVEGLKQGWSPKCENFPSHSDDIWGVIKTTAVQSLRFVEGENKQLPSHLAPRPELELFEGDLLITRAGPRARAGVTCLVTSVRPKLMICDKVYRFRAKESSVLPLYLAYFLNSPSTISLIDELKTGISESGVNLTQEKFLALPLWFPSIAEQREIVNRVQTLFKIADKVKQQYQEAQASLDKLNQSILAKAFRGELVPQNHNDEPASVLLERIRAEREKLDTKKKAKGKTKKKSRKAKPETPETNGLGH